MQILETIERLVSIPSVTGEEGAVLLVLESMLQDMGLQTERQHVAEERWNLYAGWGQAVPPVVLCTHVDTVPPFVPFVREGTLLRGRGVCDAKGSIAAMLEAGRRIMRDGGSPAYLFVCGEETDSIGAKTAGSSGRKAANIIVGEPTDNCVATGHKGALTVRLHVSGTAAHSAYPELGQSAVHVLLDILGRLRAEEWGESSILGSATMNVGSIHGGIATNVLAPSAEAAIMIRVVDQAQHRLRQLEEIVGHDADLSLVTASDAQLLKTVPGLPQKAVAFGTDVPYLRPMGEVLLAGPGSIHEAHTARESITLRELEDGAEMYVRLYGALIS